MTEEASEPKRGPLVAIVGPTGVGKTALSLALAQRLPVACEVISADSRQIYRGMDIGTAKPTPEERRQVPHHLIDLVAPDEVLTLAQVQALCYRTIDEVLGRGHLPLLVGGTGLYVRAVVEGWTVPRVPPDPARRQALLRLAAEQGPEALFQRLQEVDPEAAARIDPRNVRRVVRALEVCEATGRPFSQARRRYPPPYSILMVGLTMPREALYARVDARIDRMLQAGLVDEVQALLAAGYAPDLPAMTGLGYREIGLYLRGEVPLEEAVALLRRNTRRLIRHQYNWFRLDDPRIRWYDARDEHLVEKVQAEVLEFLARVGWTQPTKGG
jgi:tRNA dimethylallyltransferase